MKPAAFSYFRPSSLEEALQQLSTCGGTAKVIAGGQSLGPMLNMRLASPSALIDLNDLTELAYVRDRGDTLEIGALTRHCQIAASKLVQNECPLLAQAVQTIGHYVIRQRGTLGGSLAHADPAAQLALIATTLEATIEVISSSRGPRRLPASAFFRSVMDTALAADEVIRCVYFPKAGVHEGASFKMFNRRHGDYAIVAAAATVTVREGQVAHLRVGLSGVSATALSCASIVALFCGVGRVAGAQWAADVAHAVREAVQPEDEPRIPAVYRLELTQTLVERALLRAISRAEK